MMWWSGWTDDPEKDAERWYEYQAEKNEEHEDSVFDNEEDRRIEEYWESTRN